MAGNKDKNAMWALLLSLLALTTTFQQNQLVVTTNEIVGVYCRDEPLNDPPPLLSGLIAPNTRIFLAKAVYVVLGSSYLSARRPQYLEDPSVTCKRNKENIWR